MGGVPAKLLGVQKKRFRVIDRMSFLTRVYTLPLRLRLVREVSHSTVSTPSHIWKIREISLWNSKITLSYVVYNSHFL